MKTLNKLLNMGFSQITDLGSLTFYCIVLGFVFLSTNINLFIKLLISLFVVMLVSVSIKILFFKKRPDEQKFKNLFEKIDASSFPSIHTMRIFSLAIIIGTSLNNLWIIIYLIIVSVIVSVSRIYLKKHYLSDVIGGLIITLIINSIIIILL